MMFIMSNIGFVISLAAFIYLFVERATTKKATIEQLWIAVAFLWIFSLATHIYK